MRSKQIEPGDEEPAQLVLEEPVVCTYGQRFILRFYSPLITIGGGEIIFPYSYKPRGAATRAKILERILRLKESARDSESRFEYLINESGSISKSEALQLIQDTQVNVEVLAEKLISQGKIVLLDNNYVSKKYCDDLIHELVDSVRDYQKHFASESGMPVENINVSRSLLNMAVQNGLLILDSNKIHTPDFVPDNDETFNANKNALKNICMSHKWQLITLNELKDEANLPEKEFAKLIQAMRNSGELAIIPEG